MSDSDSSIDTLRPRAESGDLEAQYELGWRQALGIGTSENQEDALRWLRRAAEGGHILAQNNLGARYYSGDGVTVDLVEAWCWFSRAAAQGDRKAGKNRDSVGAQLTDDQRRQAEERLGT